MEDKRKIADRRKNDQNRPSGNNRRTHPDRRLNSIKVEWIPISHIKLHPVTRLVFSKR